MSILKSSIVSILVFTLSSIAIAMPSLYQIEIIVFENMQYKPDGSEDWPDLPNDFKFAIEDKKQLDDPLKNGMVLNNSSSLNLFKEAQRIKNSKSYRFINHTAWQQIIDGTVRTSPIMLKQGRRIDPETDDEIDELLGEISVKLNRDLFFTNLDFIYRDYEKTKLKSYRNKRNLRVKAKDLHYIDHPRFGILFAIYPVDQGYS